jgi:hypothetical protein
MGINQQELNNVLTQAVSETIENMAFMMVSTETENPETMQSDECLKTSLLILEPYPGELGLIMSKKLLSKIAVSVYSLGEEEITEDTLIDVISELLNTITGSLIRRILPDNSEYKLGLPESGDQILLETSSEQEQFTFFIDDQPFTIATCLEAFYQ